MIHWKAIFISACTKSERIKDAWFCGPWSGMTQIPSRELKVAVLRWVPTLKPCTSTCPVTHWKSLTVSNTLPVKCWQVISHAGYPTQGWVTAGAEQWFSNFFAKFFFFFDWNALKQEYQVWNIGWRIWSVCINSGTPVAGLPWKESLQGPLPNFVFLIL